MSSDSILLWLAAFGLALAGAAPAGATVRTANFTWTPATGPVQGYFLYTSIDGGAEEFYSSVGQANAMIEVDSGASLTVSVAAFDITGRPGPRSDASRPLRLCPGDFDGDEVIGILDVSRAGSCIYQLAVGACTGADMNDDGYVTSVDYFSLEFGANACPYVAPPAGCAGDTDGDGIITMIDVFAVRTCLGLQPLGNCTHADFDGSGFVAMIDLILVSQAFGTQACAQ